DDQEKEDNVNNTNNVNTVSSTVNVAGTNEDNELPFDPNMPVLEDVSTFNFSKRIQKGKSCIERSKLDRGYARRASTIQVTRRFKDLDFSDRVYKVEKALYGLHQAPRDWYETMSTYLLDNGFQREKIDKTLFIKMHKGDILLVQVYVDDIIFGSTKKELCNAFKRLMHEKFQMSSMRELTFFLGLKQKKDGIFISQDKYVAKILKKFRFTEVKNASTPMETQKLLLKDEDGEEVDVYMYRYLKGQPKLGRWYPKDSPFDLGAYTDSDYAGASLDRKSTTGGRNNKRTLYCFKLMLLGITYYCWVNVNAVEGSTMPTDPHHTPIILQSSSSQPQKTHKPRKPTRKVAQVPQPSDPMEHVADEAVHKELGDSLVRANTTASRVLELEKTKTSQHNEIASLKRRVKKLEKKNRSRTHKLKRLYKVGLIARVESLDDEESLGEDASKHGRIESIDAYEDITLVNDQDDDDKDMFDVNVLGGEEVFAAAG
nr:hypothetical protein [Tanacetum cinerariifolium]